MRASTVNPPTNWAAQPIGDVFCIPTLLGNTYKYGKALPNIFPECLIPAMEKAIHMGVKLQDEAKRMGLKPKDLAEKFGVKPPSVYDWYDHGRIHKKHYPTLVAVFGRSIDWWLDLGDGDVVAREDRASYLDSDPRHQVLIELFDGLPKKEQDELIRDLKEKKHHYDSVIEELLSRRNAA